MKNILQSQPLLLPAVSLACGIVCVDLESPARWGPLAVGFVLILTSGFVSLRLCLLSLVVTSLGISLHSRELHRLDQLKLLAGKQVEVVAILETEPRFVQGFRQESFVKVSQSSHSSLIGARLLANIPRETNLEVGKKIQLQGRLQLPRPAKNPEVINRAEQLHRKGVALELHAHRVEMRDIVATSHLVHHGAYRARKWLRFQLTKGIENTNCAKIILAMVLGEKPYGNYEIIEAFKLSGTMHVFAVSGMHVMMMGVVFGSLLRWLGLPLPLWVILVSLTMFCYAMITGMNPPAMRAAIMGSIVLFALLVARKPSLPNSLWLSAIIAMLCMSHTLFLPGFQLSYAVLISICFTTHWLDRYWKWIRYVDPFFPHSLFSKKQRLLYRFRTKLSKSLSVSSSAWLGSFPFIWAYFGLITPLAILVSLPITLMVFSVIATSCLTLTLGSISDSIAVPLNRLNGIVSDFTYSVTRFVSSGKALRFQHLPWAAGERVVIYWIPSGGAASYIGIGGGTMLDAGNTRDFYREVWPSLRKNGARMDSLIATHADINHIQGLSEILNKLPIQQIVIADASKRSSSHQMLKKLALDQGVSIISPEIESLPLRKHASIKILDTGGSAYPLADDRCLVVLLRWDQQNILFYSDAGGLSEQRIRKNHPELKADILVLGKHRNDVSLSPEFMLDLEVKHVIASHVPFLNEEKRSAMWRDQVHASGVKLWLLNQTGGVIITQEKGRGKLQLQFQP